MQNYDETAAAVRASLETVTGPGQPFCEELLLGLDAREEFPERATAFLDGLNLPALYAYPDPGLLLRNTYNVANIIRDIARIDMTIAVGHAKTYLGAVSVWLAGDNQQRAELAERITRGAVVAWALTERGHGGDLLACETVASPESDGWALTGEKWLINNATRSQLICVLARTRIAGGPFGFSIFLVDKEAVDPTAWHALPKVKTHGIRGADISGIRFTRALLSNESLIGSRGSGLDTTLKALQLTRTICCGLSLGALEHALALVIDFVRTRELYGRPLCELPNVQYEVGRAICALHIAECVLHATAQTASTTPEELAIGSVAAKAFVPQLCQEALNAVGEILGLRGFLRDREPYAAFQKIDRDHRIVAVFDGSTAICRSALIDHFPILAMPSERSTPISSFGAAMTRSAEPGDLQVLSRRCSLIDRLPQLLLSAANDASSSATPIAHIGGSIAESLRQLRYRMSECVLSARRATGEAFEMARDFEYCYAAAAVLETWVAHGRNSGGHSNGAWMNDALWVEGSLRLIDSELLGTSEVSTGARIEAFRSIANRVLRSPGALPTSALPRDVV